MLEESKLESSNLIRGTLNQHVSIGLLFHLKLLVSFLFIWKLSQQSQTCSFSSWSVIRSKQVDGQFGFNNYIQEIRKLYFILSRDKHGKCWGCKLSTKVKELTWRVDTWTEFALEPIFFEKWSSTWCFSSFRIISCRKLMHFSDHNRV